MRSYINVLVGRKALYLVLIDTYHSGLKKGTNHINEECVCCSLMYDLWTIYVRRYTLE